MTEKWQEFKVKNSPGHKPEKQIKIKAPNHEEAIALFIKTIQTDINDIMIEDKENIFRYDDLRTSFKDIDKLINNPENIKAKIIKEQN